MDRDKKVMDLISDYLKANTDCYTDVLAEYDGNYYMIVDGNVKYEDFLAISRIINEEAHE